VLRTAWNDVSFGDASTFFISCFDCNVLARFL